VSNEFAPDQRLVMLHADAKEACKQLPRGLFSLIITSPPDNIGKSYEQQVNLSQYMAWQSTIIVLARPRARAKRIDLYRKFQQ